MFTGCGYRYELKVMYFGLRLQMCHCTEISTLISDFYKVLALSLQTEINNSYLNYV